MSTRACVVCSHDAVGALDLWRRMGIPRRRTSDVFGIPETSLRRHEAHEAAARRDHVAEAEHLAWRAATEGSARMVQRAEEGLRSGLKLSLTNHARGRATIVDPMPEDIEKLQAALSRAWSIYDEHRDGAISAALEALAGVRSALRTVAVTKAAIDDDVALVFEGKVSAIVSLAGMWAQYGIPALYRDRCFGIDVTMVFGGTRPRVEVGYRGRVLWDNGQEVPTWSTG